MHILIGFFALLGTALYWVIRLSANRRNISDAAHMARGAAIQVKNLPRQRKFKKAHNKRGLDLVESSVEAATVLMIMIARSGESRRIEDKARAVIEAQLITNMQLSADDADGMVRQWDGLTHDLILPETSITPMSKILREHISRKDAEDLANMLTQVASAEETPDVNQREFLRKFREGFDLN